MIRTIRSTILVCFVYTIASATIAYSQQLLTWRNQGSDRAIVFIHGLGGDALGTFRTNTVPPVYWYDLLSADTDRLPSGHNMTDYDQYAVDYSYAFSKITSITIDEVAAQVFDYLKGVGLFRRYNHIFFITHSLGGLVTKRGINILFNRGEFGYVDKITAIVLLGVPSQGSPIADLGSSQLASFVSQIFGVGGSNQKLIKDMRSSGSETNSYLNSTENDWKRFVDQERKITTGFPKVFCGYETNSISIAPLIVPKLYASTTCDGDVQPIAKDHFSLVKPDFRSDPLYIWVRSEIDSAAKALKESRAVFYTIEGANGTELKAIIRMAKGSKAFQQDEAADHGFHEEVIEVDPAHDPSGRYVVFNQAYGATWADVFERIAGIDRCVLADISKDRRSIRLGLREQMNCGVNNQTEDQALLDLLDRGDRDVKQGQLRRAVDAYSQAVDRRPDFEPSYSARARAFTSLKNFDLALKDYDKAVSLNPNGVESYIDRAGLFEKLAQFDNAKMDYAQALKLEPNSNRALYNRSLLYTRLSDYDHAIEDLDRSISINPTRAMDWNNRCYVRALRNELDGALSDCDSAISIKGDDAVIRDTRALIYLKLGRYDDALAEYNEALKLNPKLAESLYGRSIAKRRKKDLRGSELDFKSALRLKSDIALVFEKFGLSP
jgi:tetratricopeptide (TPR) repeat protein/pimeloyl-ACP methyl ester carboxylesterase